MEITNPKETAERGDKIYNDKYRAEYEARHLGKFVAIDVTTEDASVADTASQALESARQKNTNGTFHLIKVGSAGAFRVSYSLNEQLDWLFQ
jgi:hypothetical protein